MDRPFPLRTIVLGGILLPVSMLAVACDGSGGGPSSAIVHFRNSNWGSCRELTVEVDLEEAGAVLTRRPDGSVDCEVPAGGWCRDVLFDEIDCGRKLRVVMGCHVNPEAILFHCAFSEPDAKALTSATTARCSCSETPVCDLNDAYCDSRPAICASTNADAGACENCSNRVDDDRNGFVDCDDPNCFTEECGYGSRSSSTVTCPSTTQTTSTTVPATVDLPSK